MQDSVIDFDRTGHESPARQAVQLQNERVTARIVRKSDGTHHKEYHVNGRVYGSLTALQDALGDKR